MVDIEKVLRDSENFMKKADELREEEESSSGRSQMFHYAQAISYSLKALYGQNKVLIELLKNNYNKDK